MLFADLKGRDVVGMALGWVVIVSYGGEERKSAGSESELESGGRMAVVYTEYKGRNQQLTTRRTGKYRQESEIWTEAEKKRREVLRIQVYSMRRDGWSMLN